MANKPLPVVIDTDIGDDIDDALALALALNSPELDLRGVTTVYGPVATRTKMALKLLSVYDRSDIPVAAGRSAPLFGKANDRVPNQAVILDEGESLPDPSPLSADELILRAADEAEGQLTLITIGAMTNAAVALLRDPALANRVRLIAMGGVIGLSQAEWNVFCDPEAARVCFDSGIPLTMVGLDVTLKCRMSDDDVAALAEEGKPGTNLLAGMLGGWRSSADGQRKLAKPVLHDPLAVAVAMRPGLVTTQPRRVGVETRGEFTRGYTLARGEGEPKVDVCTDVDADAFVRFFMERVLIG